MTTRQDQNSTPIIDFSTPYHVLREIGSGAHGRVFLAEGPTGRVALKVCPRPETPERQADWERERRGWRLLAGIPRHPGVVRVLDSGSAPDGDAFWVAMELADPERSGNAADAGSYRPLTLASVATAETALPLSRCLSTGMRLASALEHLQRHHLLHRDVKPGNVLFVGGKPVIADAGLVVDVREATSIVGTPGYVPPENHGSPQGDVFSLGRTLWRIATGRSPEEAGSAPCVEADTSDPDFRDFLAIVERAMSVSPERRYRSAKAMLKALTRLRRRRIARHVKRVILPILATACVALLFALVWALGRRSGLRDGKSAALAEAQADSPLTKEKELAYLNEYVHTNKNQLILETMQAIKRGMEVNMRKRYPDYVFSTNRPPYKRPPQTTNHQQNATNNQPPTTSN